MLTIGDKQFEERRTSETDAALLEATGCSAAEHAAMLANRPDRATPNTIARAVAPMLVNGPSIGDLAVLIEDADIAAVRLATVDLLHADPQIVPASTPLPEQVQAPAPAAAIAPVPSAIA